MSRRGLVYGVGINDADYPVDIREDLPKVDGKRKRRTVWMCPFFWTWRGMLARCYSENQQSKRPTYKGCTTYEPWHRFSTFKSWMEKQDWEGNVLDKDILFRGNKVYSPETCVFISPSLNSFLVEAGAVRGKWPIGVCWSKKDHKFRAACGNLFLGKRVHLGSFDCPQKAHQAWLVYKTNLARELAKEQSDPRVGKALIERYENYNEGDNIEHLK